MGPAVGDVDASRRRYPTGPVARWALPRSQVAEALWSTGGPDDTDAALSVLLYRLRRALPFARLHGRGTVEEPWDGAPAESGIIPPCTAAHRGSEFVGPSPRS